MPPYQNTKIILLGFLALLAFTILLAANYANQQPFNQGFRLVVDDRGVAVKIPYQVERVVALRPGIVEAVIALGGEDKLVGIDSSTKEGNFYGTLNARLRPELRELPVVMVGGTVNIEELILLKPDVVLIGGYGKIELIERLEKANLTVVVVHFEELDNFSRDLQIIGEILDKKIEAESLASYLENITAFVQSRVGHIPYSEKTRSLFCGFDLYHVYTGGSFESDQIEKAGGINLAGNLSGYLPSISQESLLFMSPQVIFTLSNVTAASLWADAPLLGVTAIRERQVFPVPEWGWDYGSPRAIFAIEWMATKMHPELFQDIDIVKECNDFYQRLYKADYEGPIL